jgi:hypothetical protein
MIITQEKSKQVVSSHDFDQVNCTIDAEDMRYVASLLRNNYSNTRLAVVREISANALDANAEAGVDRPIEIKLPTSMNPTFAVRDFGGGLSQEDVFGLYSKYGKSTKRTSNNYIGAFGIGKFAPLSYGDNFTCVSFHGGMKTSYNVFVDENDDTKITKLFEEPSDEPTGLSIEVAVSDDDREEFRKVAQKFFQFFSEEDMPKFLGVEEDFIQTPEKLLSSKSDDWFFIQDSGNYYSRSHYYSHVLMGRVAYPLDPSAINVENFVSNEESRRIIKTLLNDGHFYFRVPLGSVRLHHSREALEYNKATQKEICSILLKVSKEIQIIAKEKLADSQDLFEAKRNYAKVLNALPHQIRNIFENSFEWNGIKIDSFYFARDYQLAEDLILTEYEKIEDKDSRNGFKVKADKVSRISCQDNYLFMVQDLDSSHGNNLRVRTLMNDLPDLKGVYVIHMTSECAKSEVYDNWQFDLVDAKHKRYSSQVEKEKIVRNKVSGTSRASIPLFKMKSDKASYAYRNADYWENVNEPINSLELDNVQGSVNGKIIYVPIKNYKVDDENYDLDRVFKICQGIRRQAEDNSEEKDFVLFGVRSGDVKKLDKSTWVSFFDFYIDICKNIIRNNKKECQSAYKIIQFQKTSDTNFSNYRWNYGQLFRNQTFDVSALGEDHLVVRCAENWNLLMEEKNSDHKFQVAINVVKLKDEAWLNDVLGVNLDTESIIEEFKLMNKNYPLLRIVGKSLHSHWNDLKSNKEFDGNPNTNDDIIEYISLCDNKGREGSV